MKSKKIVRWYVFLLILAATGYFLFRPKGVTTASETETEKPFRTDIIKKTLATGVIVPVKEVEIKSTVSGIVEEIYVSTGKEVKRGTPLAKIKLVPDLESINSSESDLNIKRITRDQAKQEFDRQKQLWESGVIAEADFRKVESDLKIKEEEVTSAENRLQLLMEGSVKCMGNSSNIIPSTSDGTVLGIGIKEGGPVMGRSTFSEGTTIMTIADMNRMVFQGQVGETDVSGLQTGMEISLTLGAIEGQTFKAILTFISPKGYDKDGAVVFDVNALLLPHEGTIIRAGYSATAEIVLDKRTQALALHEKNLIFRNDSTFVYVKKAPMEFKEQYVSTGLSDGMNIEVLGGLGPNDEIRLGTDSLPAPGVKRKVSFRF